jgi:hypothetical protein
MDQNSDIEAWRRVHRKLTLAVIQSRDNIAAELTKRRYLLEEMNRCKMQIHSQKSSTPGNSGGVKAKKRVSVTKKLSPPPKKEKIVTATADVALKLATKNSRPGTEPLENTSIGKVQPFKTPGVVHESTEGSITAPLTGMRYDRVTSSQNNDEQSVTGGGVAGAHFNRADPLQPQQMALFYSSSPYGNYGNMGLEMATTEQMGLALQMLQSNATLIQNQRNATIDGDSEEEGDWRG